MKGKIIGAVVALAALVTLAGTIVVVPQNYFICVKRFNKIIRVLDTPGLAFKVPFVDSTSAILNNARMYDLIPSDVLTLDKKAMTVDSYCAWRIDDPVKYVQTVAVDSEAERRLDASVYNAVKNLISSMEQSEVISARSGALNERITENVREQISYYGITIMDIQIKKFDLPQDNKEAVYARMISERVQMAAQYTAEGREEAEIIRNTADKEKALLLSQARATAEQYKAEGEREYMRLLAEAYSGPERMEFYEFIRSMDALKKSMVGEKTLILPMDSPLTKWFGTK
ncbi:MAG: protease modulator HflC [Clostridiales bacterium]|jgi:membrane protease subunit HflC|nr:protease modulator HflC [Clostridiales bacterium]